MGQRKQTTKQAGTEIVEAQRKEVVDKIIADMQRDGLHWADPYLPSLTPHNPLSGTVYRGGNRIHLGYVGFSRGYEDNRWATFNQIRDAGWHVKKGAKSAIIEKWREYSIKEKNEETGEDEIKGRYLRLVGYWRVFNAAEIEGIPSEPASAHAHVNDRTAFFANKLIDASRCPILESPAYSYQAAYAPGSDRILIAPRETFRSDETFTRVLLHEMCHSTGHPSALNRPMDTNFGSPEYAKEELVAELGSLFLSADLGIQGLDMEGPHYEQHVAYLKSWIGALENDPDYLFKAASQADKADSFIMERYNAVRDRSQEAPEHTQDKVSLKGEAEAMRVAAQAKKDAILIPSTDIGER